MRTPENIALADAFFDKVKALAQEMIPNADVVVVINLDGYLSNTKNIPLPDAINMTNFAFMREASKPQETLQ